MAKAKSTLTADIAPSSSVDGTQAVSITPKVSGAPVEKLLVVDPAALDELKAELSTKVMDPDDVIAEADAGGFRVFKTGVKYFEMPDDPTLNNKQQWHYTINAFTFTSNGNMLIVSDMRASSNSDQGAIAPLYAASTNNGWSFTKGLVANRLMNGGNAGQARMMDPTIVHVPALNKTYILYGYWKVGGRNWQENNGTASTPGDSATNWTGALLAETSDLSNFTTRTIGKSGSDIDLSSAGLPSDCRGFLGGVGAGFVHSSGKVIIPIQWTKGLNDIRGGVLIGTVSGSDLRFEFKPSLTCTNSNEGLAGIGENNIFEGPNGKLIMVGRYYSAFKGSNTDAQMTPNTNFCAVAESSDFGDTWTMLSCSGGRYASKIRHAGCQGSTINFTTMNGVKCVLGSRPFGGDRSGVSIFGIKDDGTNVEVKYFKVINKNVAQAYSCLSHYKNEIGQKLGLSFEVNEFNGKTCRFDDISDIIPEVERWFRGDVSTGELNTKITELETRMDGLEMGEDSTRDSYISSDRILTLRANGFNNDTKTWEDGTGVSLIVVSPTSLSQTFTDGVEISPVDARLLRISSNNRMFYSTFSGSKFTNDACTLQFLLRIQTNKNADWRPYIAFSSGNHSSSSNYRIAFSPNINLNQIMQCCNASGGYAAAASLSKRVPTQELVMMTIVLGDTFKLYMNGEEILSKGKAGGSWGLSEINTLTIGNKINDNYNGVVEIGDVIVYNKALSPEQVKFNYSKAFGIDLNIGLLTSLETENKTDVVSAVNEVFEVANTKLTSDDFTVKQTASFVNDSTIDDSGRTWTPTVGSDGFSWEQGDSNFAVSKDTDGLKVVVAAVDFNINKLPTMPLANYLSGINSLVDSGLTIQFDYKLGDQLSNLGQWPAVFGIKRTGEDSLYFSLGLTKAESGTNYNLNYHYLNRSGNRTTGKNNTTVPSNGVITITVKIKADTLDLYANTDLVVSLQTYNVDLEEFLDKIMLGQNYQFSGSNSKSSSIFGNFKIYKGAYSADAISKGIPGWLSSLATAIKALP